MRQAEDPQYAEMLSRIRLRCPTDRDIELLNSRVGAPLPEGCVSPTSIVRRHNVRHCLNMERLKQMSALNGTPIMYCIGRIVEQSKDMTANTIFSIRYRDTNDSQDAVLALIPGAPLIVTVNTNSTIGLVNGAGVEFYGFSDSLGSLPTQVIRPPKYMLVRVLEGPGSEITLPGLPPGVVPIEPITFRFSDHGRYVRLSQFPVTLGYTITDYKCQGSTFGDIIILDLKKPRIGGSPAASPYVQLSRARSLHKVFIMRPFDAADLRIPFSKDLEEELKWEDEMAEKTKLAYADI